MNGYRVSIFNLILIFLGGLALLFIISPLLSMFLHSSYSEVFEISKDTEVQASIVRTLLISFSATLFFALLGLAVVVGLTALVSKLLGGLPGYARLVQDSFKNIQATAQRVNNALVAPALKLKSWSAAARRARQVVSELLKPGQQQ